MADDTIFETRLAAALGRYAELAPTMDDKAIARVAIDAAPYARAGWLAALRGAILGSIAQVRGTRVAYLLVMLALLLAAILIAVAGGSLRNESLPLPGRNGAIVYSFGGNNHEAVANVAMNPDGTGVRSVEAGRCPTYSSDGAVLAWLSYDGAASLVVADADGTSSRTVLLVETPQISVSYAVSPDGNRVAWFKPAQAGPSESTAPDGTPAAQGPGAELWVAPLDGSQGVRIVPASTVAGESYDSPVWSPDGRRIAFATYVAHSTTGEAQRTAIDVVAADGLDRRRLTSRPGLIEEGMSWSPDGRFLAYVGLPDGLAEPTSTGGSPSVGARPRDLFLIGTDGTGDRSLTDTPTFEHNPEWSPDGAFLAFETSAEGMADRVTTIKVDGAAPVGFPTLGPESDWFVWSPDGRQLLWQELTTTGSETYRTTLHSIDREFRQPSITLQVVDGLIVCPPSWQRLEK
jgi:Tol biopolymer transport system component